MGNICFSALRKCYATVYSYGEICVGCNCCGRYEKGLKMWKARLAMHEEELKRNIHFDNWFEGWKNIQEKNVKLNITYHKRFIKNCKERINHFKSRYRDSMLNQI